eukprot:8504783-Karenia_brevis.AAC.1
MSQWLILIHQVCKAFPQEWDVLAPVVEYLMDTEIGECGFSVHELQTGYLLLQEPDVTLAPFMIPRYGRNGHRGTIVQQLQRSRWNIQQS